MRDLEQVLTGLGLDLTGWGLSSATGSSADGRVIVGSGGQGAWLAVLPEPRSTVLLGVALVALVILRRRHRPA